MAQQHPTSIAFHSKLDVTVAPAGEWRHAAELHDRQILGVVAINGNGNLPLEERWRSFEASQDGLERAIALWRTSANEWQPKAHLAATPEQTKSPYVWGWLATQRGELVPFDTGVCLDRQCISYADIRAARVASSTRQSEAYAASQDGMLKALRDPLMSDDGARLAIEVRLPASSAVQEVAMYEVSVLDDGRICGLASAYPMPTLERCYSYTEIGGGFEVDDQRSSLGDALADTVAFPFRLVGAAARSAGIGGN